MVQTMQAVPAYPHVKRIMQADGSYVSVIVRGDERGHLAVTADGYPLFYNRLTGNYEYASMASGSVVGSGIVAADKERRTSDALTFLSQQDGDAIKSSAALKRSERMKARRSSAPRKLRINDFPTMGEQHPLVILVEFSDLAFSSVGDDANAFFNRMLNEEGFTYTNGANGSVRDFYVASSFGNFTPKFDVVGPVTVSNTCAYYGANSGGSDQYDRIGEMIIEVCKLADAEVDFSKYDDNLDGIVDNVCFIYAGYGEADSYKESTIWPHSYSLEDLLTETKSSSRRFTLDGMRIDSYLCTNEVAGGSTQPVGIGTFVHEFGHVLGLGDLYDTSSYSTAFTPGYYDTMDCGSYSNDGNTPPLFSAFERGELGWLDYTELNANTDTLITLPELNASNTAYRVSVDGTDGKEFYVLENRQKHGWDAYLPGHGMLMWHIDIDETAWTNNTINNTISHQRVDIVEADNLRTSRTVAADPFPGTSGVTQWTLTSWAGDSLLSLDDIEEDGDTVRLLLGGLDLKITPPEVTVTEIADSSFTVGWNAVDIAERYRLNVYEIGETGKNAVTGYSEKTYDEATAAEVAGLKPNTRYEVALSAERGSYSSDTVTANVQTLELAFEKRQAASLTASDITDHGFTASWASIEDANGYMVTLVRHSYSTTTAERGYDFANRASGLPELWQAEGSYYSSNGNYGAAAPSLRFPVKGGYVLVAYPRALISGVSFWGKGSSTADGYVYVERCSGGVWNTVASFVPTGDEGAAQSRHYEFEQSDSVRIRMEKSSGVFYIDDITADCNDQVGTPVAGYDALAVGDALSYSFSGLEAATSYGVTVRGKQGDKLSYSSAELTVVTLDADGIDSVASGAGEGTATVCDLSGRSVTPSANLPRGVYIIKKGGKTVKVAIE